MFTAVLLAATIVPYDLRVNAQANPLALQGLQPELSWKLRATSEDSTNLRQSAYRILVASSFAKLQKEVGDLWDSGRVQSASTYGVRLGGLGLKAKSQYFWKLQVWDQDQVTSGWTRPEVFATGIQTESDVDAKWIHGNKPVPVVDPLDGANWIWGQDANGNQSPEGGHSISKSFTVPVGSQVRLLATADDFMKVSLNGKFLLETKGTDAWRKLQEVLLDVRSGENVLTFEVRNASKSEAGFIGCIEVVSGNKTTHLKTDSTWIVDGQPGTQIANYGAQPWGRFGPRQFVSAPAQYFSKSFHVSKKIARATLYGSALGIGDLSLNGKRVSEDLFAPSWTDYRKRVQYRAFNLTRSIKVGENSLGAVLGQGWYAGYVAWGAQREHWGDTPMLLMQLELEYADGTKETVGTDSTWMVHEGPIRDEHFLHGEKFDARPMEVNPKPATIGAPKIGALEAFEGDPVREYAELGAKTIVEVGAGKYLIDFGQNLSGFVRLKVGYPAGTKITIRHGERLDAKGQLYTDNLRLAQAIDTYTCGGSKGEVWNPRMTFHGFQYIEVSGLPSAPTKGMFKAVAISSSTPESGTLKTSDPMLNQLISNAWWTQKMNFVDVPTDCPQRDERLGWTGDAQAYIRTATYYSDVQAFFQKWLVTLDDAQRADGQYPQVAPVLKGLEDGGPAWADAGVICPMTIYQVYGDKTLLARHYPQMKKFIEFCRARSTSEMLPPKNYHIFGDWLSINAETPKDVITTAYFAGSTKLVADAARILGKLEEAAEYDSLHKKIKAAFQKAFIDEAGHVQGETQTGYVLALYFDLLPKDLIEKASANLIKNIEDRDWHLSTGFVGTRDLLHVLSKIGRNDVAFRLLHNKTFPSWGFPIVNGATSIWERWDGWTPEKGFQDTGMNSFAHYAYGAVSGWMFEKIGGIKELKAGFEEILIAPLVDPNLTSSDCVYKSVRGDIRTSWTVAKGVFSLKIEVPVNTTARVVLPDGKEHRVGSGRYAFASSVSGEK